LFRGFFPFLLFHTHRILQRSCEPFKRPVPIHLAYPHLIRHSDGSNSYRSFPSSLLIGIISTTTMTPCILNRIIHHHLCGNTDLIPVPTSALCGRLTCGSPRRRLTRFFFLTTSTSVGPRAPAGRSGSRQSGHWTHPAGLGHDKARPGLDSPKSPRAARGPAGLLRPLLTTKVQIE